MSAAELLEELEGRGVRLRLNPDGLNWNPSLVGELSAEERRLVAANREAMIDILWERLMAARDEEIRSHGVPEFEEWGW